MNTSTSTPDPQKKKLILIGGSLLIVLALLTLLLSTAAAASQPALVNPATNTGSVTPHIFQASLAGANEVPPVASQATGQAVLGLSADGTSLSFRVLVNDIGPISAAHIHVGNPEENGPITHWLYDSTGANAPGGLFDEDHPISGTLTLSPTEVTELLNGNYYINVHSTAVPSGELRGQILPFSHPQDFNALLAGENEVPSVATEALGVSTFTFVMTDTVDFDIAVRDIMSITAAHIHLGTLNENGPVVHWLYDRNDVNAPGGPFDPANPITGTLNLDAEDIVDLLTGYFYVNVHTEVVPSGEIRGQIGTARAYESDLSGDNEVPPVDTDASGDAVLALSADTSSLHFRIFVDDIEDITAAHIHLGEAGTNGPVVHWLYDMNGVNAPGGLFDPDHPLSGTVNLSTTHVMDLLAGDYYLNVHTMEVPSGELRGQIEPDNPDTHFLTFLNGDNEVPSVDTPATGLGQFVLNPDLNTLHYGIGVSDILSITAAHIHQGDEDENGPVLHWLYDANGVNAQGGDFNPDNPIAGSVQLDAWGLVDLLTEYYYVNVHTQGVPSGEIRGKIMEPKQTHLPVIRK